MKIFLSYFLPGIAMLVLAFMAGTGKNLFLAFTGFLSFFVLGVMLIWAGWRKGQ